MTDDTILLDDPKKIIEFQPARSKTHGVRKTPPKGGSSRPEKYQKIIDRALADQTTKQLAELTEAEKEFTRLVVDGTSITDALRLSHPEQCVDSQGKELAYARLYDRANRLLGSTRIRASLRHELEQEMEDVTHTSLVLQNFVKKRLLWEAINAPPAQRLAALRELKTYGVVAAADEEQTKKLKSPEEVLDDLEAELTKLTS